jgi:hypothetical protein
MSPDLNTIPARAPTAPLPPDDDVVIPARGARAACIVVLADMRDRSGALNQVMAAMARALDATAAK